MCSGIEKSFNKSLALHPTSSALHCSRLSAYLTLLFHALLPIHNIISNNLTILPMKRILYFVDYAHCILTSTLSSDAELSRAVRTERVLMRLFELPYLLALACSYVHLLSAHQTTSQK